LFIGGAEKLADSTVLILNGGNIHVLLCLAHLFLTPAEQRRVCAPGRTRLVAALQQG
jgi:hypothetical protein